MHITQATYRDWVLGILVYMVVLSLFSDYTSLLDITSASVTLMASVVLQALTFWTLGFKQWLGSRFKYPKGKKFKPAKFFSLWAVLFFSKFIFLWVIDTVFGDSVNFSGFIALLIIILTMTVIKEGVTFLDKKLSATVDT